MKKYLIILAILFIYLPLAAQNVGVGNNNPSTTLDVNGAIRTRPDSIFISQQFQIVDVSNTSFIRVDGNLDGGQGGSAATIILSPGKDGQHLRMESIGSNGTNQFAKLVGGSYLSNGKRLLLASNEDFVFTGKGRYIDLFYSEVIGWTETGRNLYTSTDARKQTFINSGSFTVPIGITSINVALWGAGGFGGSTVSGSSMGGNGGFVAGTLQVTQGESLTIRVASPTSNSGNAEFSLIRRVGNIILVLAAGGGNGSSNGGKGGHAGLAGQDGTIGSPAQGTPGGGATVSAGGAGGAGTFGGSDGTNGSSLTGGNCNIQTSSQGDGGDGYFGGGGSGAVLANASGGGGGGSNYAIAGATVTHNTNTAQIVPPNPLYDSGGVGGSGNGQGSAGKVVITW